MWEPCDTSSGSSEERECGVNDLCGDDCFGFGREARSVRPEETEDAELLCAVATLGGGWVVRARDDRRGDIVPGDVAVRVAQDEAEQELERMKKAM